MSLSHVCPVQLSAIPNLAVRMPQMSLAVDGALIDMHAKLTALAAPPSPAAPAGTFPNLSPAALSQLVNLTIPPMSILGSAPSLAVLANFKYLATQLKFGLPRDGAALSGLMAGLNVAPLGPLLSLSLPSLQAMALLLELGDTIHKLFKLNPTAANAPSQLAMALGTVSVTPPHVTMPPLPVLNLVLPKLQMILALHQTLNLAEMLGVDLASTAPGQGLTGLTAAMSVMMDLRLPTPSVDLGLFARVAALARINSVWPLANIANNAQLFSSHIQMLVRLPSANLDLSKFDVALPAVKLPPLPQPEVIQAVLGNDLAQMSVMSLPVPSLDAALPSLALVAKLQELSPVVGPCPCPRCGQ